MISRHDNERESKTCSPEMLTIINCSRILRNGISAIMNSGSISGGGGTKPSRRRLPGIPWMTFNAILKWHILWYGSGEMPFVPNRLRFASLQKWLALLPSWASLIKCFDLIFLAFHAVSLWNCSNFPIKIKFFTIVAVSIPLNHNGIWMP